ncbi:MAG: hypothetical protein NT090_26775 [Acidobacteria bacterium]|nr:hypothetical protein [Acidobacteriota bacterium]
MKETNQDLAASLALQLDLLKLISGTDEGQPERVPTDRDARTLEKFVRVVRREAA